MRRARRGRGLVSEHSTARSGAEAIDSTKTCRVARRETVAARALAALAGSRSRRSAVAEPDQCLPGIHRGHADVHGQRRSARGRLRSGSTPRLLPPPTDPSSSTGMQPAGSRRRRQQESVRRASIRIKAEGGVSRRAGARQPGHGSLDPGRRQRLTRSWNEIVGCAKEKVGIDTGRIHTLGMSAGERHKSNQLRAVEYLASVAVYWGAARPPRNPTTNFQRRNSLPWQAGRHGRRGASRPRATVSERGERARATSRSISQAQAEGTPSPRMPMPSLKSFSTRTPTARILRLTPAAYLPDSRLTARSDAELDGLIGVLPGPFTCSVAASCADRGAAPVTLGEASA